MFLSGVQFRFLDSRLKHAGMTTLGYSHRVLLIPCTLIIPRSDVECGHLGEPKIGREQRRWVQAWNILPHPIGLSTCRVIRERLLQNKILLCHNNGLKGDSLKEILGSLADLHGFCSYPSYAAVPALRFTGNLCANNQLDTQTLGFDFIDLVKFSDGCKYFSTRVGYLRQLMQMQFKVGTTPGTLLNIETAA